jgi:predicted MPP superfamily phosphohydrolase
MPRVRVVRTGRWMQFRDNRGFEITRVELPAPPGAPGLRGLRVVHLSDLHLTPRWMRGHDELLDHLSADPPHLVLVSGDFVEDKYDHTVALPTLRRLLGRLSARIAVAGILGNHDGDLLARHVADAGVVLLNGRALTLRLGGGCVELVGLPGVGRDDVRSFPLETLNLSPRPAADTLRLVITHYPDTLDTAASLRPHLVLAGHTHGGQICLPGRRPLITHDSLPPAMAAGLHAAHDTLLLVSRGFGFSAWPLRLFSPAEVVEIACT